MTVMRKVLIGTGVVAGIAAGIYLQRKRFQKLLRRQQKTQTSYEEEL